MRERERHQKHIETLMTTSPLSFLIISLYPIIKLKKKVFNYQIAFVFYTEFYI
jgi:hypothetical protein